MCLCLFIIYKTNSWKLSEITIVFLFHFLGDLLIMMMWDFYSMQENKKALFCQTSAFFIFSSIWIYAWLSSWIWNYLIPQLLFIWPIIKWFNSNIKWINEKFLMLIWVLVLIFYYYLWLIENYFILIQILWFIIFPISLLIEGYRDKYFWSLVWIAFVFLGSLSMLYAWFINKSVVWVDLSYTLLPLSVFIFYLKNLKKYI